jgi:hypothetical protein
LSDRDKEKAQDKFLATAFLNGADHSCYGRLLDRLQNDYLQGQDRYPKTLTNAYDLLTNWKPESQQNDTNASNGLSFTTGSTNPSNNNRRVQRASNITCYRCGRTGHYATNCPTGGNNNILVNLQPQNHVQKSNQTDQTNLSSGSIMLSARTSDNNINVTEFVFYIHNHKEVSLNTLKSPCNIPETWILLDNQSTIDVFSNGKLLRNLRKTKNTMRIHSTGGASHTDMVGNLSGYGTVWYQPNGIANILSLACLRQQGYGITYSSEDDNELL